MQRGATTKKKRTGQKKDWNNVFRNACQQKGLQQEGGEGEGRNFGEKRGGKRKGKAEKIKNGQTGKEGISTGEKKIVKNPQENLNMFGNPT